MYDHSYLYIICSTLRKIEAHKISAFDFITENKVAPLSALFQQCKTLPCLIVSRTLGEEQDEVKMRGRIIEWQTQDKSFLRKYLSA